MTAVDLRFLRRPIWIAGHVIVVVSLIVFVLMGLWQLRRLEERQAFNELITDRSDQAARDFDDVIADFGPDQDNLELRVVVAAGTYKETEELILRSRSLNGLSGHHVLTPLDLGDGRSVLVDRGWVPIDLDQPGDATFAPPAGSVDVYGFLRKTETRGSFGPVDPQDGVLAQIARVDLARIDSQVDGDLAPVYIQLLRESTVSGLELPAFVALPEPTEGAHRGYAVQWFLFALVTGVGYPVLLWRTGQTSA